MKLSYLISFFCICLIALSFPCCLKNQDDTGSGPRAKLAIMHLAADAPALNISVNGDSLGSGTLTYGTITQSNGSVYLPFVPGGQALAVHGSQATLLQKTILLEANKYYSMFFYDSLREGQLKVMVVPDDTAKIDSVARARFLHFIPGKDTLTTLLTKDTLAVSAVRTYLGNQVAASAPFNITLKPGKYRLQLRRGNTVLYELPSFSAEPGKLYSFVGRGVRDGTGDRKENIAVIVNK